MWLNPCAIQVEKEANSELGWAVCASTTYERPCMCVLGISGGRGKDENQPYLNCRDLEQGRVVLQRKIEGLLAAAEEWILGRQNQQIFQITPVFK